MSDDNVQDLERRTRVEELVKIYEQTESSIRQGFSLVDGAVDRLNKHLQGASIYTAIRFPAGRDTRFDEVESEIEALRSQVWRHLTERLEIRRMMSLKRAKELSDWLEKDARKEVITVPSVLGFFRYYVENLDEMLREAVGEVYDFLRPSRSQYKTNTEFELRDKVILSYWISQEKYHSRPFQPNYRMRDRYVALENVFSSLDGRGSVAKEYHSELEKAVQASEDGRGETTYFRFRACKNGNLHLEFKRADLVDKFNRLAGGLRLKPVAEVV